MAAYISLPPRQCMYCQGSVWPPTSPSFPDSVCTVRVQYGHLHLPPSQTVSVLSGFSMATYISLPPRQCLYCQGSVWPPTSPSFPDSVCTVRVQYGHLHLPPSQTVSVLSGFSMTTYISLPPRQCLYCQGSVWPPTSPSLPDSVCTVRVQSTDN